MKWPWNWGQSRRTFGTMVLAAGLLLYGVTTLLELSFPHQQTVLSVLAVAAGILLLMDR